MANTKYFLKGWMQNPSGSVIETSHNFTSKVPEGDSGLAYTVEYKVHYEETTIPNYRGKRSFLDLIYEKVLTDLMCTIVTGSNIRPDSCVDVNGYTCSQRKLLGLTRILAEGDETTDAATTDAATTPAAATDTPAAATETPAATDSTAADTAATDTATTDAATTDAAAAEAGTSSVPVELPPVKFDKTYTFYVNSNDLVTDDDTILKIKMYLADP
jgi:hypothetical protein